METRTVEQVESWSTRSFADGFAGLRELSDGEFSGAVRAGGAWLFMLNGRIIGVYEGTLDDFEDADGTAYAAPHPSLPLLFSMREKGGDTRAKYYTNDTPLSEVDSTLSQGSFTGYVELSENVLSGDYYVAYYGGRSMSVAFVGASEQVVTGDEAFERAEDEVGIYEVRDVEIEVTDVPEPEAADEPDASAGGSSSGGASSPSGGASGPSGGAGAPSGASGGATDSPAGQSPAGQSSTSEKTDAHSGRDTASTGTTPGGAPSPDEGASQDEGAGRTADSQASPSAGSEQGQSATDAIRQPEAESGTTDAEKTTDGSASAGVESKPEQGETTAEAGSEAPSTETTQAESADAGGSASADDDQSTDQSDRSADEADAFSEEQEWREATTIPSLDPDRSEGPESERSRQKKASSGTSSTGKPSGTPATKQSGSSASTGSKSARGDSGSATSSKTQGSDGAKGRSGGQAANASGTASGSSSKSPGNDSKSSGNSPSASEGKSAGGSEEVKARIEELKSQLGQRKQQVQQLKERLSKIESERDEYERERDALRQEVQRLEARLENADSAGDASASGGRQLARAQAFDGTNLFVRYQSKGKATLEEAAEGEADHDDVNANLQLEHHTQFEADDVSVNGRPFEEFLTDSFEHRFVSWIIEELLYEIRDTGHRNSLRDLYESIPKIDRVDLHGSVSAGGDEEDTRKESFDVIMRDRMGNPLLVADLNDSRDPTTGEMMGSLVDASSGVAEAHDELAGAFQVTESFFEPEALETAETATSGSFLSREKRESFVKLSRKRGYHLCLVESRSGGFHLNVPEL